MARRQHAWSPRVRLWRSISALPKPPGSLGDGLLLSGGAKIYMDGSGGARTAWMHQPWNKNRTEVDGTNVGYPATDPEIYRQMVRMFHQAGVHVGTHAIGDRAIDWVVDTYAEVLKEKPTRGLRHSIIHCNLPTDHAIAVMASLQKQYDAGYPEAQAPFMWWIGDTYAGNFGPQRSQRLEPFKTWLAKGVQWGGGSDYDVTPFAARYGIWASLERETLKGVYGAHPFGTRKPSTSIPRCALTPHGPRGNCFSKTKSEPSSPASKPTSRSGITICTPCPRRTSRT